MKRKVDDGKRTQITVMLGNQDLARAERILDRLKPLLNTRADALRLVFRYGLDVVEGMDFKPGNRTSGVSGSGGS